VHERYFVIGVFAALSSGYPGLAPASDHYFETVLR
jgi:hypothetical protein